MKQRINYLARYGRWLSHRGDRIRMHRSLRVLTFPKRRWLEVLLLPVGFNLLTFFALGWVTNFWADFFSFWLVHLELPGQVTQSAQVDLWSYVVVSIPSILLVGAAPTTTGWLIHLTVTLILFAFSLWLPDNYMPLRYFLRLIIFIHGTALLYFAFSPASFPYDLETYSRDALILMAVFLYIIPWILAFSYYIYEFPVIKKVGVTLLMMAYFCIFAPTQLLVHAVCLHVLSALMLPILFLVFGAFLNVMLFMAFYSWAMSD